MSPCFVAVFAAFSVRLPVCRLRVSVCRRCAGFLFMKKKMIAARFVSDGKYRPIVYYSVTPDGTIEERNTLVPYNNVLEFLQKNPDCCTVIPDEEIYGDSFEPISFWDRFWGGYSYGVLVKVLITEKSSINGGPEVTETNPSEIHLKFNNCGKCRMKDSYPY